MAGMVMMQDTLNLMQTVMSSPRLPTLPGVALQIIAQIQEDEVSIDSMAETVSLDPALSSKILKTVNSSFYGQSKSVSSIQQAVVVLGLNSVKTLALGFSLVSNLTGYDDDQPDLMMLWRRSLYTATVAKRICELINVVQMEEMFLAGLLQDVGVLALRQVLADRYTPVFEDGGTEHSLLRDLEQRALGCDHTEVGAALAERWGLPPLLVLPIRYHENPDEAPEDLRPLVRIVKAGAIAAELMIDPKNTAYGEQYLACMMQWFKIGPDYAGELIASFFKQSRELQKLFAVPAGEVGGVGQIIADAHALLRRIGKPSTESVDPASPSKSTELAADPALLDPLTGVANRRAFDESVCERFLEAEAGCPLTLMYVDVDHFTPFNDELGPSVGDETLRKVADTITATLGEHGKVYRHGGDEFAVLCLGVDRRVAAGIAERVRLAIENLKATGENGDAIRLTASIGVATYEGSAYRRPEQLIKAAESSVYAAKSSGRNCVRVFTPRPGDATQAA